MTTPALGSALPAITLLNQHQQPISLQACLGQWLILYFYPKASTPGCTTQACGLRDTWPQWQGLNAHVLGVSPDATSRLLRFHQAQQLNFDLLSDEGLTLCQHHGVWQLKQFMGRSSMGVARTTFLYCPEGQLKAIVDDFKTANHHEKVLSVLKALQA